jgi:hypothetical protein
MDAVAYKNGPKNQWRRTVWNLIGVYRKPGPILYLPGSTDLDRAEAIKRGIPPANLIAVERDEDVAKHLREMGVTTINAGLLDVIESWPTDVPLAALVADLQCGLDPWVEVLAGVCARHPALTNTTLVVNLQRGRDKLGADWCPEGIEKHNDRPATEYTGGVKAPSAKSRGFGFYLHLRADRQDVTDRFKKLCAEVQVTVDSLRLCNDECTHRLKESGAVSSNFRREHDLVRVNADAAHCAMVEFHRQSEVVYFPSPYQSTPKSPYFDSCVVPMVGCYETRLANWKKVGSLGPQIAAALAIRTRKLRGELNGGHHKPRIAS